jgi:hypothetical protein
VRWLTRVRADGLAGGFADVDADVEAVGAVEEMPIRTVRTFTTTS